MADEQQVEKPKLYAIVISIAIVFFLFFGLFRGCQALLGESARLNAEDDQRQAKAAAEAAQPRIDPRVALMHAVNQSIIPKMVEGNPKKYIGSVVRFRCKVDNVDQAVTDKSFLNHEATADVFCDNPGSNEYDTALIKLHGAKVQNLDKDQQIIVVGHVRGDDYYSGGQVEAESIQPANL